jgi:hypothetical protein
MAVNKTPAYLARLEKRKEVRLKAKLAREKLKEEEKKDKAGPQDKRRTEKLIEKEERARKKF